MHPVMQQRVEGLAALRERAILATADFYAKIDRTMPTQQIRYQIVTKGKAYHIIELASGQTKGFAFSYRAAVTFSQAMEAATKRKLVGR